MHDAAIHLIDLCRQRVDLDADLRGRLVHQVDRLVGQEAICDVALRERRRGDQGAVLDANVVVHFIALLQPAQDRDRVLDGRLAHEHRLEAALQRRILLDVLAVLVQRRRAHHAQFPAREHRLEQVGCVHGALRRAGSDHRVQLVDEQDHGALRLGHLFEHALQSFLELASIGRARDQGAHIQRDHAPVAQGLRHVLGDDPLRQPLHDRRLAHSRLADQHRVVLRPSREHLDHTPDLLIAPDHGVQLALLRALGEVAPEALQRALLLLLRLRSRARRVGSIRRHLCSSSGSIETATAHRPGARARRRGRGSPTPP